MHGADEVWARPKKVLYVLPKTGDFRCVHAHVSALYDSHGLIREYAPAMRKRGGEVPTGIEHQQVDQKDEQRKSRLSSASMLVNVLLTLLKAVVGVLAHSDALLADAAHSFADVVGSVAVIVGLRVARRPADQDHPYGHGKAEVIAASLVAILLILAGLDVVYASIHAFFGAMKAPDVIALYTALLSIVVKEVLYRYQIHIGRRSHSPALIAGAADHRSDVYASIAAAIGIGISELGWIMHKTVLLYADPAAGLIVAVVVVWVGYRLAKESFTSLMDQVLDQETTRQIAERVSSVVGVRRVDDLRIRSNGSYWVVDVKVSVNPDITVAEGHTIGKAVKLGLTQEFTQVYDVFVHVNPYQESR